MPGQWLRCMYFSSISGNTVLSHTWIHVSHELQELKISSVYDPKMSPENLCKRNIPFSHPPIVWGGTGSHFWGWEPRLRRASFEYWFVPSHIQSLLSTDRMPAASHAVFVCGAATNCSRFLHMAFPCLLWHPESSGRGLLGMFHMLYLNIKRSFSHHVHCSKMYILCSGFGNLMVINLV